MKKVLSFALALVMTVSSLSVFGGALEVKAATNITRGAATEIADNGFVTDTYENEESKTGRWFKITNYKNECAVAEVTMTDVKGSWPHYEFFYSNGKGTGNSGFFTSDSETQYVCLEARETVYIHIYDDHYSAEFNIAMTMQNDHANSLKTAKKTYKSGKCLYGDIQNDKDVDVFKIKAKKTGKMTIKITNNDLGNDLSHLNYTVFDKNRRAKAKGRVDLAKTKKVTVKVKKGQCIYVQLSGYFFCAREEKGSYVISTKIK